MQRVLEPELLDELSASDPRAVRARRDLRVINGWMRNGPHLLGAIQQLHFKARRIVEVGCGDGTLSLKLARRIARESKTRAEITLLDMQPVVGSETIAGFSEVGWDAQVRRSSIQEWLESESAPVDLIFANLFLHHFTQEELRSFFCRIAKRTRAFISCDPRRWQPALISSKFLWLLGCNSVTRHDATISVRAGFRNSELSAIWPNDSGFQLKEYPAGYASHLFVAERPSG